MNKQLTTIVLSRYFVQISFILLIIVIPLGFEPKTDVYKRQLVRSPCPENADGVFYKGRKIFPAL